MHNDIVIKNGKIVNGKGKEPLFGDIAIKNNAQNMPDGTASHGAPVTQIIVVPIQHIRFLFDYGKTKIG